MERSKKDETSVDSTPSKIDKVELNNICNIHHSKIEIHERYTEEELLSRMGIPMVDNTDIESKSGPVDKERMTQFATWMVECIFILYYNCSDGEDERFMHELGKMHTYMFGPTLERLKKGDNFNFERFTPQKMCPDEEYELYRKKRKRCSKK